MNKKRLPLIIGTLIVVIIVVIAIARTNNSSHANEVKIGFFGPLSGDEAPYGEPSLNGLTIAANEINTAGGIDGKKVVIIAEDSKCDGATAVSAVTKLTSIDHVDYLVGGSCSSEVLAATPVANAAHTMIFSPFASSPQISGTGVFRVVPSDAEAGPFMASQFIKSYKSIAIISENSDYALGLRDALSNAFIKDGGTITDHEEFTAGGVTGTTDFRTLLQKVQATHPDLIFINPQSGASGARIAKQARELGIKMQFATFFITGTDFTSEPAADGTLLFDVPSIGTDPTAVAFTNAYVAQYGTPEYPFAAGSAYDILHLLKNAVESVGQNNQKIASYLYAMPVYHGVVGTYTFDKNGDVQGIGYTMEKVQDGKAVPLTQ